MTPAEQLYLCLIRAGLHPAESVSGDSEAASYDTWRAVFALAVRQGTAALAHSGMLRLDERLRPGRALRIEWAMHCERLTARHLRQTETASELAETFARHGIRTTILKGLGLGTLYPDPALRESGDIDLWLGEGFRAANDLLRKAGAAELCDMHKHAVFSLHGLRIENHRTLLSIHRSRAERELNDLLCRLYRDDCGAVENDMAADDHPSGIAAHANSGSSPGPEPSGQPAQPVGFTPLQSEQPARPLWLAPPPTFEAIFVLRHAANHFLDDGISFHHLCDWACVLEKRWPQVDHALFERTMAAYGMQEFAALMTAAAIRYLGAQGELPPHDPALLQRFLGDLLAYAPAPAPTGRWEWLMTRLQAPWSIRWRFGLLHIPLHRHYREKFIEKWHDWFSPRE